MYKTWMISADDEESLARQVESHLNEFAAEVLSVSYTVADVHRALLVYRSIEIVAAPDAEAAVAIAEHIIDEHHV